MASDRFFPFYTGLPRFGVIVVYADRVLLLWLGNTPWRTVRRICHISHWHAPWTTQLFWSEVKALLQSNGGSKERGLSRDSHTQVYSKEHIRTGSATMDRSSIMRDARPGWHSIWVNVFPLSESYMS